MERRIEAWRRFWRVLSRMFAAGWEQRLAWGGRSGAAPVPPLRDGLLEAIREIERAYQSGGREGRLSTGFPGFDRLTGGIRAGELLMIAAVSGMGKTAMALNLAHHVALRGDGAVALFSLESSRRELILRLLCSQSGVALNRLRSGCLCVERDFPRLVNAAACLSGAAILVEDPAQPGLKKLRERLRELREAHDLRLVIIDSFQLLCDRVASEEEAARVSREIKRWAREFGVAIVLLAHLDAPPAGREWGRPALGDLGACRVVEREADVVALLWRRDLCGARPEEYDPGFSQASLIVVKNRHGEVGEVPLLFRKEAARFENRALENAES